MKDSNFEKWQETLAQELRIRDIKESIAFLDKWEIYFKGNYSTTQVADFIEDDIGDLA